MKITGMEWKAFFDDDEAWGGACYDDEIITVNGAEIDGDFDISIVDDDDVIDLIGGVFYDNENRYKSLQSVFMKWRRKQKTAFLLVEVPKELKDSVINAIKNAGGRVKLK